MNKMKEQWIWINDSEDCPTYCDWTNRGYEVVSFQKKYHFVKPVQAVNLRFSGDTFFRVFINKEFVADGPPCVGGDYLHEWPNTPYQSEWLKNFSYYAYEITDWSFSNNADRYEIEFFALVRKSPIQMNEFSKRKGGFYLQAELIFEDGTREIVITDETWIARKESAYVKPYVYDDTQTEVTTENAIVISNIWNAKTAPIPPCDIEFIRPLNAANVLLQANEKKTVNIAFDMVYAGYIKVECKKPISLILKCKEVNVVLREYQITLTKDLSHNGIDLLSVGEIEAEICNLSDEENEVGFTLTASHYPIQKQARTRVSDEKLNDVLDVCVHSLKQCRQSMHLDSPKHCEPLGCVGDYYIQTLMTAFSFGDMRLAEFDLRRISEVLVNQKGSFFTTTYSLIWVLMLNDVYMYTGNKKLLEDCEQGLEALLERFDGYMGHNGLLETPPSYMFIDWLMVDGYSLHHPPKALGQTCLNLFYYGALQKASYIYDCLNQEAKAKRLEGKANTLKEKIIKLLWDEEKGLFFEGLNTPTKEELIHYFMPQNTSKRYYRKHANILAAYFSVFKKEKCREILERVINDESLGLVQPYFMHFFFEAIYRNDLKEKYTLKLLNQWKKSIENCAKGLPEGFYAPGEGYPFDYSHAWAGTPAYSLPIALSGLTIKKAGFEEVTFSPSLLGLEVADVEIPTVKGIIRISMQKDRQPIINVPEGIKWCIV